MANSDKNIRITTNKDTTSLPKIVFTGQNNSPITLYVLDDNTLSFEGSAGQLFSVNNVLSTGYIFGINDISGIPSFRINADGTVGIAEFTGNVGIGLTNPAFKLNVNGSAGFGASIWSSPSFSSSISGVILNNGAITNSGQISSTGRVSIQLSDTAALAVKNAGGTSIFNVDTTNSITSVLASIGSTSTTTGALVITGGVGIGQTLFTSPSYASSISGVILNNGAITGTLAGYATTASNIRIAGSGNSNLSHTVLFTPVSSSSGSAISSDATFFFNPLTEILSVSGLAITATTVSNSTATGALQVAGGVGISGRLSFNQAAIGTTGISTNPTIAMIGTTGDPIYMSVLEDNTVSFEGSQGQLFSITPNLSTGYIYSVNDITGIPLIRANANANVTANEFAGNFGIGLSNPAYKLHVIGSVGFTSNINSTSTSTGTLVVGGGVGIAGTANIGSNAFIGGNLSVTGNLTVNGTTTTIESTVTTLADPIFVLGAAAGGTQPFIDDNKDRGIEFRYVSGVGKTGFFGFQDSTGKFTFIPDGTNTGEVFSGAAGTAAFGTVEATTFVGSFSGTATTSNSVAIAGAGNSNLAHRILFTPNSTTSGSAISSDTTISFNPSTEILSVSGLAITASTASTSSSTGAMIVSGGVGIGGTVYVAGDETVLGRLYYSQSTVGIAGTSTIPSIQFIGQDNNPITLSVLTDNTLSFEGSSGQLFSINNNLSSGTIFSVNDISGIPIIRANANGTLSMGEFSGNVGVGLSLPTFKFQVSGSSSFGGTVVISSTTASTSTSSGALTVAGGVGIGGSVIVGGRVGIGTVPNLSMLNIQTSSAGTTGLSILASPSQTANLIEWYADGGVGAGYSLSGRIRPSGHVNLGNPGTITMSNGTSALLSLQGRGSTEGLAIRGYNSNLNEPLFEIQGNPGNQLFGIYGDGGVNAPRINVTNSTGSTSTTTGALIVTGGVGIGGSLNTSASFTSSISGLNILNGSLSSATSTIAATNKFQISVSDTAAFAVKNGGGTNVLNVDTTNGITTISSSTASTSSATGALIVSGGVGIGNSAYIGGRLDVSNTINYTATNSGIANTWTRISIPSPVSISGLTYGNGLYVGVGYSAATSTDGVNWTARSLPHNLTGVGYGNGLYVGVLYGSALGATSTDGITWRSMALPATVNWLKVAYGNGIYVASADSTTVAYSYNGFQWATTGLSWPGGFLQLAPVEFGGGYFIIRSNGSSSYWISVDGINWTRRTNFTTANVSTNSVAYGDGAWVLAGSSASLAFTKDLLSFTYLSHYGWSGSVNNIAYTNGTFAIVDGNSLQCTLIYKDLSSINVSYLPGPNPATTITAGEGKFVAGAGSTVYITDIATHTFNIFPNNSGEINNVRIGAKLPSSAQFSHLNANNLVSFGSSQPSTSTTTGALVVTGGVGIGGSLFVGNTLSVGSSAASTSTTTGALIISGGVGIGGSLYTSSSFADSISGVILNNGTITGTLSGYATTSNNIRIVGAGNSNLAHPVLFTPASSSSGSAVSSDNTFFFNSFTEVLSVSGLAVTASTASTSSTTGALIVTGGVGVGATITVGLGISTPILTSGSNLLIKPGTDSTTAIQFTRTSTALPVVTIDTLNSRVGIGVTNPEYDLEINGEISATTKSFLIPHPTKENMKLRYGSLEGPENGVYIRGELKDSNEILLPDYWDKLIDHSTITVHLTPIGNKTIFVKEIKNNKVIVGARLFQKIHCFYSIWAERKDVPKLKVEF